MPHSSEFKRTKEHMKKCREYQRSLREHIESLDRFMDDDFFKNPRRCWALLQKQHQEHPPEDTNRKLLLQENGLEPSHGKRQKFAGTIWRLLHPDRQGRHNRSRAASPLVMHSRERASVVLRPAPAVPHPSTFHQRCDALESVGCGSVLELPAHPKRSTRRKRFAI